MDRLAWFSPMPPVRSGVATYSTDLVRRLSDSYDIDVFVSERPDDDGRTGGPVTLRSAHEFVWRHRQRPYFLAVYQLGNSSHHEYMWPYLFRYPGLVVLHDARLQHARAAMLLRAKRADDYRVEFVASHPDTSPDLAELAVKGFDNQLYYSWPMTRLVVQASRAVAVHARSIAEDLAIHRPGGCIEVVRLGHGTSSVDTAAAAGVRARHGIPEGCVLFGCFGGLSPEKRVPEILRAFAWLRARTPGVHLLLAGGSPDPGALLAEVRQLGLESSTTLTGYLDRGDDLDACIAATDVALTLRWPTAREISGPWLRCLALGKPTVMMQLAHLADVPALDPRDWQPIGGARVRGEDGAGADPVAVAVDLLDEEHSLRLAMQRLAIEAPLRASLGHAAQQYWRVRHSIEGMVEDYRRIIPRVAARAAVPVALPGHLINDGDGRLRTLLEPFGLPTPLR
jgi:glycosyltransferase involved in cell wall biosynthesis